MKGVIYWTNTNSRKRAEDLFEQIVTNYHFINTKPIRIIRKHSEMSAQFENGDMWQCIALCSNLRGIKANLVYVPYEAEGYSKEIAISTAVAQPYHGVIYY